MHKGKGPSGVLPVVIGVLVTLLVVPLVSVPDAAAHLGQQRRDAERRLDGVESDLDDANTQLDVIERRHAKTAEELKAIEGRIAKIHSRIAQLEEELAVAKEELAAAEQALADTEAELADTEVELDETRDALSAQQEVFSDRVRGAYKQSNISMAAAVLEAEDVREAADAAHFAETFMARDMEQIETITSLESRVQSTVARLGELRERRDAERLAAEEERDRIAGLVDEQRQLKAQAEAEAEERRGLLAKLEKEEAEYERLVGSLEAQSAKLERKLAKIAAEERRIERQRQREAARKRRQQEKRRQAAAASRSSSSGSSSSSSGMLRPVPGPVTSTFGYRTHPIAGTRRLHAGIDYGSPRGTPIKAADSGKVISAGRNGGLGNAVIISHGGGKTTVYAHQSRLAVRSGQRVSRGKVIGYVGTTGYSTGPHLHFEVRINGRPVNPAKYL